MSQGKYGSLMERLEEEKVKDLYGSIRAETTKAVRAGLPHDQATAAVAKAAIDVAHREPSPFVRSWILYELEKIAKQQIDLNEERAVGKQAFEDQKFKEELDRLDADLRAVSLGLPIPAEAERERFWKSADDMFRALRPDHEEERLSAWHSLSWTWAACRMAKIPDPIFAQELLYVLSAAIRGGEITPADRATLLEGIALELKTLNAELPAEPPHDAQAV